MDNKYILSSLENALQLIDLMAEEQNEMGITEISNRMNLGKSTVHRTVNTLLKYGYINQSEETFKYSLGFKFVNIADAILQKFDIITVTRDCIEELVGKIDENAILVSYSNMQVSAIENYPCRNRGRSIYYYTGVIFPAYASSAGKAIIDGFDEKQKQRYFNNVTFEKMTPYTTDNADELKKQLETGRNKGYYECNQEINEGVVSYSVPILNVAGKVEAALCIYGSISSMNNKKDLITKELIVAGKKCSQIYSQKLL